MIARLVSGLLGTVPVEKVDPDHDRIAELEHELSDMTELLDKMRIEVNEYSVAVMTMAQVIEAQQSNINELYKGYVTLTNIVKTALPTVSVSTKKKQSQSKPN